MPAHDCEPPRYCRFYALALQQEAHCPVHGSPGARCMHCGRFMKRETQEDDHDAPTLQKGVR